MTTLDEQRKNYYEEWLKDENVLNHQALQRLRDEMAVEFALNTDDPIGHMLGKPLPPIEKYRVPFDIFDTGEIDIEDIDPSIRSRFIEIKETIIARIKRALRSGIDDTRKPLDSIRQMIFEQELKEFSEEDYPDEIPEDFTIASCTIFGHICPVYFAAEAATETATERRRGRYIPFPVKMRVVRRDNYTCQMCSRHLNDIEVEFDHIIPVSKGGSSEEHNVRLTCFDCNRSKSDEIEI